MWNATLNQAGVEASYALRRAKNVYYPPPIRAFGLPNSSAPQADTVSKKVDDNKGSPTKVPRSSTNPPKEAEQAKTTEKEKDTSKGVVPGTTKPPVAPKNPSKGKEILQNLEIILATFPMPAKEDSKGKRSNLHSC